MEHLNDAGILAELTKATDEACRVRIAITQLNFELEGLEEEISGLHTRLITSMESQDVYSNGNTGHKTPQVKWLIGLGRDIKKIVVRDIEGES